MSVTDRGRAAARQTIRMQRRIAIVQALLWPVAIGTVLALAVTVALKIRAGRGARQYVSPAAPPSSGTGSDAPTPARP
ncbi:hypothetical protein NGTWS0302_11370 [Mycolicibacterium cyprinidarum]|uniref:Uncharacterized protein n=1 Tax=Mycolicibacterium cyprinidarum TaxID=2860311 RepID=A0ABQ4V9L0_9MYCO|nr:hypothetical protein NGTWS1803_11760 [Mycolicibacterium sp. NGTWS1803]GJF15185.1 hypothetical protein NGTWS1702_18160 [Mycolicibacterium sp. NGTWSNA01]GJF16304.1 hypothetical protein NGTWS0302_11370 [Mycolicibacterium sp. NGTWS0302]